MNALERLTKVAENLDDQKLALLSSMAESLGRPIKSAATMAGSDIATEEFLDDFGNRLLIHHSTTDERLNKRSFEYQIVASFIASGRAAARVTIAENPNADIEVDGVMYSLKTEASAAISADKITISKLLEARWIRECKVGRDYVGGIRSRVVPHLESYGRILMLRSFNAGDQKVRYELVEIPTQVLLRVGSLVPSSFSRRTANGSVKASVSVAGRRLFTLRLDGSVEKVTISQLNVSDCMCHACWELSLGG